MHIKDLELPSQAKEALLKGGYGDLYPPQEEAVKAGVLEGRSLVLASPTASGKTLVAELCALKHILTGKGKVLYLTPLRALASEKHEDFRKYAKLRKTDGGGLRLVVTSGDFDSDDPYLAQHDLIIATNEKADSLLRHRAHWIGEITLVVADEVHLLNEPNRGPTLEVTLTRLREVNPQIQILALSATVKNAEEIAEWLGAGSVTLDWRPVTLREGVAHREDVFYKDGGSEKILRTHPNQAVNLALDTIRGGGQALIFAETRRTSVSVAEKAASKVGELISQSGRRRLKTISEEILSSTEKTRLSETLAKLVSHGVAAHHAGLASAHRRIVEDHFRGGAIKLVVATPTLAAGVNLPARRVIVNSYARYEPGYGRMEIPILEYKQMAGRAGRPRYDKVGEAIIVAPTAEERERIMEYYVCSGPEKIWSKLAAERILGGHVLATIATGFARDDAALFSFFSRTFYAHQYGERAIKAPVAKTLDYLVKNKMVRRELTDLNATEFGRRTSELYIDPESAVLIREGLTRRAPVLTDLSFLQLACHTPDAFPKLYPYRGEGGELELFLEDHREELIFEPPEAESHQVDIEAFLGELKCIRVLEAWIREVKEAELLEEYRVEPGDLYRLVETVNWLLYAAHELAALFKHKDLIARIDALRRRVKGGIREELLPLVALEGIGRVRGRALFDAGYKTVDQLKKTSLTDLRAVPGVGGELARKIKEQVGGLIRKDELEGLKAERAEQKTLQEFG